jgi:DNA-binding transcriptional ArsR family regulator
MSNQWIERPEVIDETAGLMRLLGDPTRIRVLGLLRPGEMNVTALCRRLELAQPTVSHHLGLLRTAKLVRTRRDGKQIYYSLNPEHLEQISDDGALQLNYGTVRMCIGCNGNGHDPAVAAETAARV